MRKTFSFVIVIGLIATSSAPTNGAGLWVVGVLEDTSGKFSQAKALSADGNWIVGTSRKGGAVVPFSWSKTQGLQQLPYPGGSLEVTGCTTQSGGTLRVSANIGGYGRIYQNGNWTILPPQPGSGTRSVYGIIQNPATQQLWVVGSSFPTENQKGYRYDGSSSTYIDFWGYYQDLYSVAYNGWAVGKNNWGNSYGTDGTQAAYDWRYDKPILIFNWNENCSGGGNCGWDQLNRFAGYGDANYYKGRATAIAPNARWAVGYLTYTAANLNLYHAFKWQVPTNPQLAPQPSLSWTRPIDLGTLGAGDTLSYAYAVSDHATNPVIGGTSYGTFKYTGYKAVYWTNAGVNDLDAVLQSKGVDMSRWASLSRVVGVSADGTLLAGYGFYDDDDNPASAAIEMAFLADISDAPPSAPVIALHPASQVGCLDGNVTFTMAATGAAPISYQWQKDGDDLANDGHFSGVTTPTLTILNAGAGDTGNYHCIATNAVGSTPTNAATLALSSSIPSTPPDGTPTVGGTDRITWRWTDVANENGYRVKDTGGVSKSGDLTVNATQWQETGLAANTPYTRRLVAFNACGESAPSAGQTSHTLALAPAYGTTTATPTVSCDQSSSASGLSPNGNVSFTATNGFGDGPARVGKFGWLWNQTAGTPGNWTGETFWTAGSLVTQVGASGSWYLHLRSYNNASPAVASSAVLNLGPYTVGGGSGFTCLQNPGFEDGFTSGVANHWTKYNYAGNVTCAADSSQKYSGAWSQRIESASSSSEGGIYQQFNTTAGQGYTIRGWFRCSNSQVAPYIGIDPYGGTNPQSAQIIWKTVPTSTNWVQTQQPVTALSSVITIYLDMTVTGGTSGSLWIDDVEPACTGAPAVPADATPAVLSTTSIRWEWADVATETGYRVKDAGGAALSPDLAANTTNWTETNLTPNTQYSRKVHAFNAFGESAGSTGQTRYTHIETPAGVTFGTITAASIQAGPEGTLSGLASGSSGVRISNTTADTSSAWQTITAPWTSTGLQPNTPYTFVARARNGDAVETADSPPAVMWTLSTPPGAGSVSGPSLACINSEIVWTAASAFGIGSVQLYRYVWDQAPEHLWTDNEPEWSTGTLTTVPNALGTWYLHVKGYNAAGAANGTFDYAVNVAPPLQADFDGDCDVDADDFAIFEACATGPNVAYLPAVPQGCPLAPGLDGKIAADFDEDADVDQTDFGVFQRCFRGPDVAGIAGCAD